MVNIAKTYCWQLFFPLKLHSWCRILKLRSQVSSKNTTYFLSQTISSHLKFLKGKPQIILMSSISLCILEQMKLFAKTNQQKQAKNIVLVIEGAISTFKLFYIVRYTLCVLYNMTSLRGICSESINCVQVNCWGIKSIFKKFIITYIGSPF